MSGGEREREGLHLNELIKDVGRDQNSEVTQKISQDDWRCV